jgi:GT2 family glycosyltransferase
VTGNAGGTKVVVSIVNTNGRDHLLACLESLDASEAEIVVLDNASDDGSVEAVHERFPGVRVIAQPLRAGFGTNHNSVLRATKSEYVLVLNEDTQVSPGSLDTLVRYLDEHPNVAVAGPLIRGFDGLRQGSAWRLMTIRVQLTWALTLGRRGAVVSHGSTPKRVDAVAAGATLYRRRALEEAGLFDEAYFMFGEEADLARRLTRLGYETHYVPTAEILHHGQQATAHVPERQINEFWRSLDIYLGRYHSPLEARVLRWLTGLGYAFAVVAAAIGGRLPRRLRPAGAESWNPRAYRLHVRNAFRGDRDPGLRELAEDWNRARGVAPSE